jgi:hypothetical protein
MIIRDMASPLVLMLVSIEHMQKKRLIDLADIFRITMDHPPHAPGIPNTGIAKIRSNHGFITNTSQKALTCTWQYVLPYTVCT